MRSGDVSLRPTKCEGSRNRRTRHIPTLAVASKPMPVLAQCIKEDLQSRAANDDDINGGLGTRTKYSYVKNNPLSFTDPSGFLDGPVVVRLITGMEQPPLETVMVLGRRIPSSFSPSFSGGGLGGSGSSGESGDSFGDEVVVSGERLPPPTPTPPRASPIPPAPTPQGDPCPGVGQVTPAPKQPFDPKTPISSFVTDLPAGSISVTAPDGTVFNAPGYADFAGAYAYGRSLRSIPFGLDAFGLQVAVGHGGMYDFQRAGQTFIRPYIYASNYAVGIVLNGAGYSRANAIRIAGGYAAVGSSNTGDPAQLSAWNNGWNAAASGSCTRTN